MSKITYTCNYNFQHKRFFQNVLNSKIVVRFLLQNFFICYLFFIIVTCVHDWINKSGTNLSVEISQKKDTCLLLWDSAYGGGMIKQSEINTIKICGHPQWFDINSSTFCFFTLWKRLLLFFLIPTNIVNSLKSHLY